MKSNSTLDIMFAFLLLFACLTRYTYLEIMRVNSFNKIFHHLSSHHNTTRSLIPRDRKFNPQYLNRSFRTKCTYHTDLLIILKSLSKSLHNTKTIKNWARRRGHDASAGRRPRRYFSKFAAESALFSLFNYM